VSRRKGRGGSGRRRGERDGGGRSGRRAGRVRRSGGGQTGWSELEAKVVQILGESSRGPLKSKDLATALSISAEDERAFKQLLLGMQKKGTIYRVRGHRYALSSRIDLVTGPVSMTRDGHGFVRTDDGGSDVYVPAHRLDTALDGDTVVVRIEGRPRGRSREGAVVRVLERARETVVGTFHEGRRVIFVRPLDARMRRDVLITPGDDAGAQDGHVVVVRITSYGEGRVGPTGTVVEVLGYLSDPGVDVLAVAHGYGVSLTFPDDLITAAEVAAEQGMADPGPDRIDRTGLLTFTIDPADAKDHDDALSIETVGPDRVEVGVHIADVSHFVRIDSPVDIEAAARGTSVYLVDRTVPMLPPVLSNEVCSLNPREPRFALSLFVTLDREGRVHDRRYEHTVIECREALSYEQAQEVLDGEGSIDADVDRALRSLDDHARAIRAQRVERGALDLDLPESKVILDPEGHPIDIRRRERLEAHRLIEDYMILANEVVANDLEARGLLGMYRIHEDPAPEKVEMLSETLARYGVNVPPRRRLKPSDVQRILATVRGRHEESLVNTLVLRSLRKARYDTTNVGHFGLASEGYAHFTSPIRRYPDLVVHRVVSACLVRGQGEPYRDADALTVLAERCSAREQSAAEAERESVALKKVEYMERHLGEEFHGRISGVTAFGFFVTLEEVYVEGLVHVSGMLDDYYRFEERQHVLVGERGGRTFRLGDRVLVQVARVDKEARHIDFAVVRRMPQERSRPHD
jgi:ribonuclease R